MSRYDGLIIPRSYSEYINKTDAATLSQALQLNNALDDTPTEDSRGGVRSSGVFDALATKQPTLTFDNAPTQDSNNPVKSGGIYTALGGKQDTLTFDNTPTANSNNPVKSGGVKTYVDGKVFPDYSTLTSGVAASGVTLEKDMFLSVCYITALTENHLYQLTINNNVVKTGDTSNLGSNILMTLAWSGQVKAGSTVRLLRDSVGLQAGNSFSWLELN